MLSHLPAYHHHTASNMHHPSVSSASQFEPLIRPLIPRQNHVCGVCVWFKIGQLPLANPSILFSLSLQMLSFTAPPFSLSRPSVGVVEHPIRIKPVEPKKKKGKSKKRLPHAAACCCWRSVQSRKRSNNKKPKIAASFVCLRPELIRSAPLSPAIAHVLISVFFPPHPPPRGFCPIFNSGQHLLFSLGMEHGTCQRFCHTEREGQEVAISARECDTF